MSKSNRKTKRPSSRAPAKRRRAVKRHAKADRRRAFNSMIDQLGHGKSKVRMSDLAAQLHIDPRTLYNWRYGDAPVPQIAILAVERLLERKNREDLADTVRLLSNALRKVKGTFAAAQRWRR